MPRQTTAMTKDLAIEIWQAHYHRGESDHVIADRLGIGRTAVEMTLIGRKYDSKPCRRCRRSMNRQTPFGICMICWLQERDRVEDARERNRRDHNVRKRAR